MVDRALEDVDDDVEIVSPGSDHSYNRVWAYISTAEEVGRNYLGEWYGEEHAVEGGKPIQVVVIA